MAEIKKIVLNVGGKEITLSPGEAKELKAVLEDLFGSNVTVKEVHHWDHPYRKWYGPYWQTSIGNDPSVVYCSTAIGQENEPKGVAIHSSYS